MIVDFRKMDVAKTSNSELERMLGFSMLRNLVAGPEKISGEAKGKYRD